jgi:nucleotide-binding universal stress UspA family protein
MKHKLLVAVRGDKGTAQTVEYVRKACSGLSVDKPGIVLFHVLPPLPPWLEAGDVTMLNIQRDNYITTALASGERMLAEMKDALVSQGLPAAFIETEVSDEIGKVSEAILDAARRHECDTIVLGRRGQSMIGQFFGGSVAEQLLRNPIGLTIWLVE